MEQDFLNAKAEWIAKMEWGDMAEAARIAGVSWQTFQEWVSHENIGKSKIGKRNLEALKQAVRNRQSDLKQAIAA